MSKLVIDYVSMFGFRSWNAGMFKFEPGVTLVTGTNGSGKSSIGMAVQYAINGKLPKLTKDDLKQRSTNTPMKVRVSCTRDGEELAITRGGKILVQQGNEIVSVRENNFLADLQRSVDYSFLSQNMASFVDMPEYKRRELLDTLIPEVTVLRSVAAPSVKNLSKRYFDRRYNFQRNIQYVEDAIVDMDNSIKSAKTAYENSLYRFEEILKQQKKALPFTEAEHAQHVSELAAATKSLQELERYKADLHRWLTDVQRANRDVEDWERLENYLIGEQQKIQVKIESLERSKQNTDMTCPKCKMQLTCANCGTRITDANASQAIDRAIAVEQESYNKLEAQLQEDGIAIRVEKTPLEEIKVQSDNLNRASNDIVALQARKNTLQEYVQKYNQQLQAIETAKSIVLDKEALSNMEKHIQDLKNRKEELLLQIERKKKVFTVMQDVEESLTQAADVLYSVLPTMYFDQFLRRLTYACNYLLEAISTMRVEMSASADGISVFVSGQKLAQLSSGELQRVRIAITLSFSLLAVRTDTLFLDEMFDTALDEEGVAALAVLLRGPVMKFYDKVVVITHKAELMATLNPDRIIRVFKDKNGMSKMENVA